MSDEPDEIVRMRQRAGDLRRRYIEAAWALRDTLNEIQQHAEQARERARELRAERCMIAAEFIEYHLEDLADLTAPGFADAAAKLIRVLGEPSPADAIALADRLTARPGRQRYQWARACEKAFNLVADLKQGADETASEQSRTIHRELFDALLPGYAEMLGHELEEIDPAAKMLEADELEAELRASKKPGGLAMRLAITCGACGYQFTEDTKVRNQIRVGFSNLLR